MQHPVLHALVHVERLQLITGFQLCRQNKINGQTYVAFQLSPLYEMCISRFIVGPFYLLVFRFMVRELSNRETAQNISSFKKDAKTRFFIKIRERQRSLETKTAFLNFRTGNTIRVVRNSFVGKSCCYASALPICIGGF